MEQEQRIKAFKREMNLYNQTFSQYFVLSSDDTKELTKHKPFLKPFYKKTKPRPNDQLVTLQQLTTQLHKRGMVYEAYRTEVKRRFLKGEIHPDEINAIWLGLAQIEQLKAMYDKDYYERLADQQNVPAQHRDQINYDLLRGVRSMHKEKDQGKAKKEVLREVLHNYVIRNNLIGYCQGFNMMANFLLERGLGKVDTFFMMTHLVERLFPWDYYTQMHSLKVDLHIIRNLLRIHMPSLYAHFAQLGINIDIFTDQWLLTAFTYSALPWPMLTHMWTSLLLYGRVALICGALALFALQYDLLMAAHNLEDVLPLLKDGLATLTDVHALHQQMLQFPLSKAKYRDISQRWLKTQQTIEALQQRPSQHSQSSSFSSRQCHPSYFYCLSQPREITDSMVFSCSLVLCPDMNYLSPKGTAPQLVHGQQSTSQSVEETEVLVMRSEHICPSSCHDLMTSLDGDPPQQMICCSISMPDLE